MCERWCFTLRLLIEPKCHKPTDNRFFLLYHSRCINRIKAYDDTIASLMASKVRKQDKPTITCTFVVHFVSIPFFYLLSNRVIFLLSWIILCVLWMCGFFLSVFYCGLTQMLLFAFKRLFFYYTWRCFVGVRVSNSLYFPLTSIDNFWLCVLPLLFVHFYNMKCAR